MENNSFPFLNFSSFVIPEDSLLPEPLPNQVVVTFLVLYLLIILLALFGNIPVIIIIGCLKKTRSVTDVYILSLAVSDLLIATLNMPFHLHFIVVNEWLTGGKVGEFLCKFTTYIQGITIVSSILTLLVIAIDRYVVICNLRAAVKIHTKKSANICLAAVWLISLCAIIPHLVFQRLDMRVKVRKIGPILLLDGFGYICAEFYPNDYGSKVYTAFTYGFLYILPVVIMAYTYGKISHRLWIHQPIGDILENPLHHQRVVLPKEKIIKVMIVVFLAFAILWLPFFTFSLYAEFVENKDATFRIKMAVLKLIGYSNCCVNPIIYTFLNKNFQREVLHLLCKNRVMKIHVQTTVGSTNTYTETIRRSKF
ncbi:QRFP-like peptide receptor [Argopecten irradians]|uniref:QRFP-like peptide receptor n=1 Tax=Argopecten irradians TaxID=31199 RepID=UPI003723C120